MKNTLIIFITLFSSLIAQIQYGGQPVFFTDRDINIDFLTISNETEKINRNFHPMVFQYGDEYLLDVDILDYASSFIEGENVTFMFGVESPDAHSISFNFSEFFLTENSKMFFYDNNRTDFLGSFTSKNNKSAGDLSTTLIQGDKVILEVTLPLDEVEDLNLRLHSIIHDYTDIMNYSTNQNREDCNINVVCSEGDDWRDQIKGVVRVTMGGGLCSASIVNNTANDRTPYVLFADHCVSGSASSYVFHFNYESSTCSGTGGPLSQSVSGSTLLASADINSGPDFALLRLTSDIPDSYDPFYVGWSRSSFAPQEAVGIHHPGANIKKISFTNDNVTSNGYYWEFQYQDGRVIPGSSGSPFFDQNQRQVGIASYIYTNYCDPSPDCYCDQQYNHGYGRFDSAWNMGMSSYLDPINTGETAIDGIGISGISISHTPFDDMPFESTSLELSANILAYTGTIEGAELHYDLGEGWTSQEMTIGIGGESYSATLDGLYDGMLIEYYILAVNSEGIVQTFPNNAPDNTILFILGDLPDFYTNSFESESSDWSVGDPNDQATAGIWERTEPLASYNDQGTLVQTGEDNTVGGTYCFITGNGYQIDENTGQNAAFFDDVDGGETTLFSPTYDLSELDDAIVTYWRWYTNNIGDNGNSDKWIVSVSNNGGGSWVDLENTSASQTEWQKKRFILSDYTELTSEMVFKFIAEDIFYDGDAGSGGSLVEAGLDDFTIEYISSYPLIEGDINGDESVNVLDVILLVNMILEIDDANYFVADLNDDGELNVQDIVLLINLILLP